MRSTVMNHAKRPEIGKSYVFYETLKTNLIQFPPKPLTRVIRARSQDANTRKLITQINELENSKRLNQEKLKIYEHQIEELIEQLGRMHSINKQLLHSKLTVNPAEVEFIVSELQNSEIRARLSQGMIENDRNKAEIESLKKEIERLLRENKILEDEKIENMEKHEISKNISIPETVSSKSIEERLTTPRINSKAMAKTIAIGKKEDIIELFLGYCNTNISSEL